MTAFHGVRPHVPPAPLLPVLLPDPIGHRGARVTGGHPLMPDVGVHVRPHRSVVPYLAAVLVPLVGVLLVLLAVRMAGQPSDQVIPPALQVSVSPSPSPSPSTCTYPDGS